MHPDLITQNHPDKLPSPCHIYSQMPPHPTPTVRCLPFIKIFPQHVALFPPCQAVSSCTDPSSMDKVGSRSCVHTLDVTQFKPGCTGPNSLPLTRLLGSIFPIPLYLFSHLSLALKPWSLECVTSRILPILSFFHVVHHLYASITVCSPLVCL